MNSNTQKNPKNIRRKWVGIFFNCCAQYGRAYLTISGMQYKGQCPQCGKTTSLHSAQVEK